jgi:hypothetical protein
MVRLLVFHLSDDLNIFFGVIEGVALDLLYVIVGRLEGPLCFLEFIHLSIYILVESFPFQVGGLILL